MTPGPFGVQRGHSGWAGRPYRDLVGLAVASVLGASPLAVAQPALPGAETGVVARIDSRHNVIILEDGRMLRATPATVIVSGGAPTRVDLLKTGAVVVVHAAQPVVFRDGHYVALSDSPAASVPVGAVRTRIFGYVKDVDRDGDVKIQTHSGTFHITVSPDAARAIRDGDTAAIEVMITPPAPRVR